jgi:hypothetical protein
LDTLNVSTWWGLRSSADQIRCTLAGLTPLALAMLRHDQWVSPAGVSCSVARTISATCASLIVGLRPRPGRTAPNPASPSSTNRSRHEATEDGDTASASPIAVLATPCPASSSARAATTSRCAALEDLARAPRTSR